MTLYKADFGNFPNEELYECSKDRDRVSVITDWLVPVKRTDRDYTETERQEVLDAGVIMIHQHGKGKQECLMIEGCTNPRVILTALRVLRHALGEPA